MIRLTCIPVCVRLCLEGLRGTFRHRHFLVFSWLLVLQVVSHDKANLKALSRSAPRPIAYHHLRRLVCATYWWSKTLLTFFADQAIKALPAPNDGILYLISDSTYKGKRGKKNPVVKKGRIHERLPYVLGIQIVFLVLHWGVYRIPVDFCIVRRKTDQNYQKENALFREMLQAFQPPPWAKHVIVLADAAYASKENFKAIKKRRWFFLMACARTWNFENGKALRDLVNHLPYARYKKTWVETPNGRRRRYVFFFAKRVRLRHLGDVTVVLSKYRRNHGPKHTKILVTNLPKTVKARTIVAIYQRRWHVELLIWELKSGLGLGQHQVTQKVERVERSMAISVLAYLMLVKLRAKDIPQQGSWSLFQLKQNFIWQIAEEQWERSARKKTRNNRQIRNAA